MLACDLLSRKLLVSDWLIRSPYHPHLTMTSNEFCLHLLFIKKEIYRFLKYFIELSNTFQIIISGDIYIEATIKRLFASCFLHHWNHDFMRKSQVASNVAFDSFYQICT